MTETMPVRAEVSRQERMTKAIGRFQRAIGRETCRRRPAWCTWVVLGRTAVCITGGEIASVGTDGEIRKLEVSRG